MGLNDICDKIYVISLPHRYDRREHAIQQAEKFRFEFEFFDAIDGDEILNFTNLRNGENGLLLTYDKLIQKIDKEGHGSVIILEDDFEFVEDLRDRLEEIDAVPDDWNLIYLGMNRDKLGAGFIKPQVVNDKVIRVFSSFGAHAILLSKAARKNIAEKIKMLDKPLDVMYCDVQQEMNAYGFVKNMCVQFDSHSDIIKFNPGYRAAGIFD